MKKKIKIIDILCYISTGDYDKVPKEFYFEDDLFKLNKEPMSIEELFLWNSTDWLSRNHFDLNDEVEILVSDEENEFENIEEIEIKDFYKCDDYQLIRENFKLVNNQVNQLIKNQKKIIERLKEEGK